MRGVRSGMIDARDRAKTRGRRDRDPRTEPPVSRQLEEWLAQSEFDELEASEMRKLDLKAYLSHTSQIDAPPAERLRKLAIHVESDFAIFDPDALDRIYQAALRYNEGDPLVWHSRGFSAQLVSDLTHNEGTQKRFAQLALKCLERAWALCDQDPIFAYSLGIWHYNLGEGSVDAAEWFERAIELDPKHGFALLYRAHCLQDREQWRAAVEAFDAVPLEAFKGPGAWLVNVLIEARAHCLLQAGDRERSLSEFTRLLRRLNHEPGEALGLLLHLTEEACKGEFREELGAEWAKLQVAT